MTRSAIATGSYSAAEAAKLAGLTASRVRRWVQGYGFKSRTGEVRTSKPLIRRVVPATDLQFADLVEVLFVHAFLRQGVSMHWIRRAAEVASEMFQSPRPFSLKQLRTDGQRIFALLRDETDDEHIIELARRQYAFVNVIRPYLRQLEYEHDIVARWFPLGRSEHVVIDPRRAQGRPIVAKRGVPTAVLYAASSGGQSAEEISSWYEVPLNEVTAAIRFEEYLREPLKRRAA